jgi:hypothetical protein
MAANHEKAIESCATARIRSVAKSDLIYDSAAEARDAESAMAKANKAKNSKDFDKAKKACLSSVDAGEKAVKPWQAEMDNWDRAINDLDKAVAEENDKLAVWKKEHDAVSAAIDEINSDIKRYNDSLLLCTLDPRYRPPVTARHEGSEEGKKGWAWLSDMNNEGAKHAQEERETWSKQKDWVSKPIDELKQIKGRVSKAKYTGK